MIESMITNYQSSKKLHVRFLSHPEVIIDGHTLRWPQFQMKNAIFEGN